MSGKRYKPGQIVNLLRKIEVEIANGKREAQAACEVGIRERIYHRWQKKFGRLKLDPAVRLKEMQEEKAKLQP